MAGGGSGEPQTGTVGQQILALAIVVVFAGIGGFLTRLLKGYVF